MESHSMRRRQTVLGEQLQQANNSSNLLLAVPSTTLGVPNSSAASTSSGNSGGVGHHMRSFSRLSVRVDNNDSQLSLDYGAAGIDGRALGPTGSGPGMVASRSQARSVQGRSAAQATRTARSGAVMQHAGNSSTSLNIDDDQVDPALVASKVDAEAYLARKLAGLDPAAILAFGEKLRADVQKAQDSEQRNAQRNYKALSIAAASIAKLTPAVGELHRQIADLSLVIDAMRQDAAAAQSGIAARWQSAPGNGGAHSGGPGTPKDGNLVDEDDVKYGSDRRQSMIVLNSAWQHGLNELYRRVEGAQRIIPAIPGRHVVLEEPGWLLLNLVTRQPVKPVLLVILNDFCMLAGSHHGRLAYECHWPLGSQLELDLDEREKTLRVRGAAPQTSTISGRTASGSHKTAVSVLLLALNLRQLRKVYSELCKLNELASATRPISRKDGSRLSNSHHNAGSTAGSSTPGNRQSGNRTLSDASMSQQCRRGGAQANGNRQHARNLSRSSVASAHEATIEQRREAARIVADIDRSIAHRQWSAAIEQVLQHDSDHVVGEAVRDRARGLETQLLGELKAPNAALRRSKRESAELLTLLIKLGHGSEARQMLLTTAATDIEAQTRDVHFMGDVVNYISQMAAIYFQTIISTVRVYQIAFLKKEDTSVIVAWAKSQVDLYAAIFNRQLFRIRPEFKAYQRCREVSRLESLQLRGLKMDMEFMLRYVWEN